MSDEREQIVARGGNRVGEPSSPRGRRRSHGAVLLVLTLLSVALLGVRENLANHVSPVLGVLAVVVSFVLLLIVVVELTRQSAEREAARRRANSVAKMAKPVPRPAEPPEAFRKRLATYLHVPEGEVLVPRERPVSAMPFWSAVELPRRSTMAKSIEYIRQILLRIRATVRGMG